MRDPEWQGYTTVAIKRHTLEGLRLVKKRYKIPFSDCVSLLIASANVQDLDKVFLKWRTEK
jgi:hypothetical protein